MGIGNSFYFFHGHIEKMLLSFGSIFTDMVVARFNRDGDIQDLIYPIPITLSNGETELLLNESFVNLDERKKFVEIFPRMTYSLEGLQYDSEMQLSPKNKISYAGSTYKSPVNFIASLRLNIIAKTHTDAHQIFEQIVAEFDPSLTINIKDFPLKDKVQDLVVTMVGTSIEDNYENSFEEIRRVIYTIEFETRFRMFSSNGGKIEYSAIDSVIADMQKTVFECEEKLKNTDYLDVGLRTSRMVDEYKRKIAKLENIKKEPKSIRTIALKFHAEGPALFEDEFGNLCYPPLELKSDRYIEVKTVK
jgi:T4-like virus Myoviridae tail sheath stabiliser